MTAFERYRRPVRALCQAVAVVAAAALWGACSSDDTYSIDVTAKGLGTQNLRLVYMADDAVHTAQTTALDDRFSFSGKLDRPTAMDVYASSGALLARLVVSPGEHIEMALDIADYGRSTLKGSAATQRLVEFLAENPAAKGRNAAIARYVGDHTDDPVSAVLMTGYYDTESSTVSAVDSLLELIDASARSVVSVDAYTTLLHRGGETVRHLPASLRLRTSAADSAVSIALRGSGRTLLALQDLNSRPDLKRAVESARAAVTAGGVRLVEVSLAPDSLQWALSLQADTLPGRWTHAFTPAGVMDPALSTLGITRLPYYFVADSSGLVVTRTSDPAVALKALAD